MGDLTITRFSCTNIDAECGSAHLSESTDQPSTNLCAAGETGAVSLVNNQWIWTCTDTGTDVSIYCHANYVDPMADLAIRKDGTGEFTSGGLITYTINYINDGPDTATGISITDTLSDGLEFISADPMPNSINGNMTTRTGITLLSGQS